MQKVVVSLVLCVLICYLTGCFNMSYFLSKLEGIDIREHGSGNAGGSNTLIVLGKKKGVFVMLTDIFKAYFAVKFSSYFFSQVPFVSAIAASAVIIGHIFPFYMQFKGGKGFASLGGSILAIDYRVFLCLLILTILICFLTDYICFGPTTISLVYPIVYGVMFKSVTYSLILGISSVCIWYRHIENFKRIREGTELRFSFLWNRKSEAERLGIDDDGKNYPFEYDVQKDNKNNIE